MLHAQSKQLNPDPKSPTLNPKPGTWDQIHRDTSGDGLEPHAVAKLLQKQVFACVVRGWVASFLYPLASRL